MVGNQKQVAYLKEIISQFEDINNITREGLDFYKGVIVNINVGQGKTTLIKELDLASPHMNSYIYEANNPKIKDFESFIRQEIIKQSIIFIDDIDILLKEDNKAMKELIKFMANNKKPPCLIIATCSDLTRIDKRLLKPDYFSQVVKFDQLNIKEKGQLVKYLLNDKGRSFEKHYTDQEVGSVIHGYSPMDIKLIVDYILLHNMENDVINFNEYNKTTLRYINDCKDFEVDQKELAIHEAGHIIVGAVLKEYFPVGAYVSNVNQARTLFARRSETAIDDKSIISFIKAALGGPLATKLIYGRCDIGGTKDLDEARYQARYLINKVGYYNISDTIDSDKCINKLDNEKTLRNTKLEDKLIRKCEKEVTKILKSNKDNIYKIANILTDKGYITLNEIITNLDIPYQLGC